MSSLKQYFPANRLAQAVSAVKPLSVEECLKQADENLRHIAGACADHVDRTLEMIETKLREWPSHHDVAYLETLYQLSLRLIGAATTAGLPDLDRAAASFCKVLEGLAANSGWDRDPVQIHVSALRLLRRPAALGQGVQDLIAGLAKMQTKYVVG